MHSETDEQTPSARAHITPEPRVDGVQGKRCKGKRGRHARGRSTDRQNYAHRAEGDGRPHTAHRQIYGAAVTRRQLRTCLPRKVLGTQRLHVDAQNQNPFGIEPDNRNLVKVRNPSTFRELHYD